MTGEANSIKTMRRHYFDRLAVPSTADIEAELTGGNDRATITSTAALLDAALGFAIADKLPNLREADEAEFDQAFSRDGPLSSFSAKIDLAFYIGAIDSVVRGQLHDIRAMRNVCAHTRQRVSFEHDQLTNVARRVFYPTGSFRLHSETPEGFRKTFAVEGILLYHTILDGREVAVLDVRNAYAKAGMESPI